MAEPTAESSLTPNAGSFRWWFLPLAGFFFATVTTLLCRSAAGVSLGLFFGAAAFATLFVPPLTAGETRIGGRAMIAIAVSVGISIVWCAAIGDQLTAGQWLACSVALAGYAAALGGLTSLLVALRANLFLAAGFVTFLGLLWLAWPVWLSHAIRRPGGDDVVAWLVPAHPLFAMNAALIHFDTWDRYTLAYAKLTVLNQDVFYSLPAGVFWATAVHAGVGLIGFIAAEVIQRWRNHRRATPSLITEAAAA